MTLEEMIKIIEAENPNGLRLGDDENGYTELSKTEADSIFLDWAKARLLQSQAIAEAENAAITKRALLDRLGITADEAQLLLS